MLCGALLETLRKRYTRAIMASPIRANVLALLLRIKGIFEVLGRKGGGFELFRGGYAKCMLEVDVAAATLSIARIR